MGSKGFPQPTSSGVLPRTQALLEPQTCLLLFWGKKKKNKREMRERQRNREVEGGAAPSPGTNS